MFENMMPLLVKNLAASPAVRAQIEDAVGYLKSIDEMCKNFDTRLSRIEAKLDTMTASNGRDVLPVHMEKELL